MAAADTSCRSLFDYPTRKVRGVESVLGPSIERNFVKRAEQWAHGTVPAARRSRKTGDWAISRSRKECFAGQRWDTAGGTAVT